MLFFIRFITFRAIKPARLKTKKHHFRVQQITNLERSEDSNLSSEGEKAALDQSINFQSDLLSSSGSFSLESYDDNEENETEAGITESENLLHKM